MITIIDDFLEPEYFEEQALKLKKGQNLDILAGDKLFHIQFPDESFIKTVVSKIEKVEHKKIHVILSFFRCATDVLDVNWRIHSDFMINGVKPDKACVLYMSKSRLKSLNGTAFWSHEKYGDMLTEEISLETFDDLLLKDSEDLTKWTLKSVVGSKENRVLIYPANYFHSKFPDKAWREGRYVFVMFYKYKYN